jgi:hypothetical protein
LYRDGAGFVFGTTEYTIDPPTHGTIFAVASPLTINVAIAGTGAGSVASLPAGVACAPTCSATFTGATAVTLSATPADANSVFTGWLGACTGRGDCAVGLASGSNVKAVFAPNDAYALRLDADESNSYDALTDGLLISRYLAGLTGSALTAGALGPTAALTTSAAILQHLGDIQPLLDIDGNGKVDAATDGLLVVRYLFGLRGSALIDGAVAPDATRKSALAVETYLQTVFP